MSPPVAGRLHCPARRAAGASIAPAYWKENSGGKNTTTTHAHAA